MLCIIPARGGSTRIPGKNIKDFHGKPIIAYSIETAHKSGLFDRVFVSTDNSAIAQVAIDSGAKALIRNEKMSLNETGTQEVARYELKRLRYLRIEPENTCVLYATSPLLSVEELRMGFDIFKSLDVPYVYSTDVQGNDAGCFYFGKTESFINEVPLEDNSGHVILPNACDINTPEDWARAEQIYGEIHGH